MIIGKYQAKSISQLYGLMPVFAVVASASHTWCWLTAAVGKRTLASGDIWTEYRGEG
jgi:hypothetical protein